MSELTVTAFTKQLFAIRHSLQKEFPGVANIQVPDTDRAVAIPAHPGAAAYIDGNERTFLERYSNFMWLGLMVLSGLASGGPWLRSYLHRDERVHNTARRNRLVDMIAVVRQSGSLAELDQMQKEADEILRDTLSAREDFFDAMRLAGDFTCARESPDHVFDRHVLHPAGVTEPVRGECVKHATSPQTFAERAVSVCC